MQKNGKIGKIKKNTRIYEGIAVHTEDMIDREDFDFDDNEAALEEEEKQDKEVEEALMKDQGDEDEDLLENKDYEDEEEQEQETRRGADDEGDGETEKGSIDDSCLYKFTKYDEETIDDDHEYEEEEVEQNVEQVVKPEDRESRPILTKYERVRILGDRAKQLSLGAKPMLLNVDTMDPKSVAKLELERGVIPFIIEKPLPDGRIEKWRVSELKIIN